VNPFNQPLKGVRVLDLSRLIAGPLAAMILSDLGAEVVKVEAPDGDEARRLGDHFAGSNSGLFLSYNRNKRSVVLDLRQPKARELALELADRCDALIENFRPGVVRRLGLGYDVVRKRNPRLIYCSISGYGQTGPDWQLPAFEAILQAASGTMSVNGEEGGRPVRLGAPLADFTAGLFAALSIVTTLHARRDDGRGRYLDISLLEGQLALVSPFVIEHLLTGVVPVPLGTASQFQAPSGVFPTAGGELMVMVGEGAWPDFCRALGVEHLLADPRFANNRQRIAHRKALSTAIEPVLRGKTAAEWLDLLRQHGIPCGPVNSVDQVVRDPQVTARRAITEVTHPAYGPLPQVGPVAWRIWPAEQDPPMQPPPLLGEHTDEVLREYLGLSDALIGDLRREGIIGGAA